MTGFIETVDALGRRMRDPYLLSMLASIAVSQVQKNIQKGSWTPNAALTTSVKGSSLPLRDRGQLLSSFFPGIADDKAIVGTNHIAARILHDGGTITPKRTRFLAVPAGGQTRAFMRQYGATPRACIEGMKAAGYSIFFSGPVLMAKKKEERAYALFIMKRSVKIPARPFMKLPPESVRVLEKFVSGRVFVS